MRYRVGAAAILAIALLGPSCSRGGPEPGDVLQIAFQAYPGATETGRSWLQEEHARSIDGPDLSHPARLTIHYQLRTPMPNTDLFAWYREQLTRGGWTLEPTSSTNGVILTIEAGHRRHFLRVEAGGGLGDLDANYSVQYTIDFAT